MVLRLVRRALLISIIAACTARSEEPRQDAPEGWDREIALATLTDRNPDPRIVEVDLEARIAEVEVLPGKKTKMWTYNGGLPGPLLRAKVGDTLIVHFKNKLPEPTTIHWHGLRVPADMDGNGMVTVPSGGSFDYRFTLPDAGTFWYHPHHRSAAQVGYGLYGPLVVDDPSEPKLGAETTLILSDASIDDDGTLLDSTTGGAIADLFGREGGHMLVNGREHPTLHARPGVPIRLRMINASRSRYYRMALDRHTFTVVGGDGGLRETPVEAGEVMIVPGERIEVVIVPRASGTLKWLPFERGFGTAFARVPEPILELKVEDSPAATPPPLPARLRTVVPLDPTGAIVQHVELTQMTDAAKTTTLGINGKPFSDTTPLRAKVNETDIFEIVNTTEAHHPFHLHGFFFQQLGPDGKPITSEWKDTLNIPAKETRKVIVKYDDRPGMWMFHCHILDHADLGMMGMLELSTDGSSAPTSHAH
jgi:FtsP/CotA-like multicopper oxidase with cupredoxin domain